MTYNEIVICCWGTSSGALIVLWYDQDLTLILKRNPSKRIKALLVH